MFQCHWVKFLQFHLPEWVQIWLEQKANISDWNQCTLEQCSLSGLYIHSKQFMVVYWEYNSWVKYKLEQLQFAVQHSFAAMQLTQLRLQRFNIKRMLSFVQLQLLVVTSDTQQLNKISKLNSCWQVVSTWSSPATHSSWISKLNSCWQVVSTWSSPATHSSWIR